MQFNKNTLIVSKKGLRINQLDNRVNLWVNLRKRLLVAEFSKFGSIGKGWFSISIPNPKQLFEATGIDMVRHAYVFEPQPTNTGVMYDLKSPKAVKDNKLSADFANNF